MSRMRAFDHPAMIVRSEVQNRFDFKTYLLSRHIYSVPSKRHLDACLGSSPLISLASFPPQRLIRIHHTVNQTAPRLRQSRGVAAEAVGGA